jgi:hypothetical protein
MLIAFTIYKFIVLVERIDPDVSKKDNRQDLGEAGKFFPNEMGFDFSVGMRGGPIPPEYGYFLIRQINFYYDQDPETGETVRKKAKTALDLVTCGSSNFDYYDQD